MNVLLDYKVIFYLALSLSPPQAMLLFTGSSSFDADLSPILRRLVEDESDRIRRTIASGFHEVIS